MSNRCGNEEVIRGKIRVTNCKVHLYQRLVRSPFIPGLFICCVACALLGHDAQPSKPILTILICTNFIYIVT